MNQDKVIGIPHKTAKSFVERWHYSGKMPTGKCINYGWFVWDLYAVAVYGIGVNPYIYGFLEREHGILTGQGRLLELRRLARVEPKREMYLSRFLSKCHKELKKSGYEYVISYSDPEYGHNGGIYKASNFAHIGKTNPEWHLVDECGGIHHRRVAHRYAERRGVSIGDARHALGLERIKRKPKDRWLLHIG